MSDRVRGAAEYVLFGLAVSASVLMLAVLAGTGAHLGWRLVEGM